jgi:hypothetical protein
MYPSTLNMFSLLKKVSPTLFWILGNFCLNLWTELTKLNAVNAFIVPFGLIFLLNNNFTLQFLYPSYIFTLKNIWKNKDNSLPTVPILKSEVTW